MKTRSRNNQAESWNGPAIGLLDLDAFFASVEQLDHPDWRGKPVIVGSPSAERGVVSTASYEARAFGVHSAMPSAQAERLCPQAIWTKGHFRRYKELSGQVMMILANETPYLEQVSIDEAFFDITPGPYDTESIVDIVQRINGSVEKLGITCSIGVGSSKTVAKIASEKNKPHGMTIVTPGSEERFLAPLPVSAMSGIGKRSAAELKKLGIRTLGDLAQSDPMLVRHVLGNSTGAFQMRARGLERSRVKAVDETRAPKSISREHTFARDVAHQDDAQAAIALLGESVGQRLRKQGLIGRLVTLKVKYGYNKTNTAQKRLEHPTDDENIFVPVAQRLMKDAWNNGAHIRLIGLGIGDFTDGADEQPDLFTALDERGARTSGKRALSVTIDNLRERFGSDAIKFGRSTRFEDDEIKFKRE